MGIVKVSAGLRTSSEAWITATVGTKRRCFGGESGVVAKRPVAEKGVCRSVAEVGPRGSVTTTGGGDPERISGSDSRVASSGWSGGFGEWLDRRGGGQDHDHPPLALLAIRTAGDIEAREPEHHRLDRLGFARRGRGLAQQRPTARQFRLPAAIAQQPVMANADEIRGQGVQQKPPEEFLSLHSAPP